MTSITAHAPRTMAGRRATFVPAPRTLPAITTTGVAIASVATGATALVATAATFALSFL